MHDYVCFIASIDYCIDTVLYTRLSVKIALISYWNDFILIPLGSVFLREDLWKYANK